MLDPQDGKPSLNPTHKETITVIETIMVENHRKTSGLADFKKILIVAGEASGDLHGANLVKAIKDIKPNTVFFGIGGNRLREAGVSLMADCAEMGVVGLTEVLSKLGYILRVFFQLKAAIKQDRPDLVILIDYPDFNMPLAKAAKKAGVPVFYYISPTVWAWRKGRIGHLKQNVSKMAVIFPFEPAVYKERGMDVDFVGHPLLDLIEEDTGERTVTAADSFKVGILPGSRRGEVKTLLPDMLKAAEILCGKSSKKINFFLPLAETLERRDVDVHLNMSSVEVEVIREGKYSEIKSADAAMVASGTAALETALLGTPLVVLYRVSPLTYFVGRCLVKVKWISMANIIAKRLIVPELIQHDMTPERIASELSAILEDPARAAEMRSDLKGVREKLGSRGASARAARLACELIS